jgi:hypothetical protein
MKHKSLTIGKGKVKLTNLKSENLLDAIDEVMTKKKQFRVWWIRNPPSQAKHYPVKDIDEAINKLKELTQFDLKSERVSSNAGGLEVLEDGDWSEYYDDNGNDIDAIIEAKGGGYGNK